MFDGVVEFFGDLLGGYSGAGAGSDDERALAAYESAWKLRQPQEPLSHDLLVQEMKAHNVPGVYSEPEHQAALAVYFDGWRDGRSPESIREEKRDARKKVSRQPRERWSRIYIVVVLLAILAGALVLAITDYVPSSHFG